MTGKHNSTLKQFNIDPIGDKQHEQNNAIKMSCALAVMKMDI